MTRMLLLLAALLVALPCAVVSGSRLIGGAARSPIPELAAFAPWAILGWVLVLFLLLAGRWWWITAAVLVLLAVQLSWVLPSRGAQAAAGARPGAVVLRVLTINAQVGGADVAEIVRLAQEQDIDLLAVQECQPGLVHGLTAGLGERLPHLVQSNPNWADGTVIWSRWPLSSLGPSLGLGHEISRTVLRVPGAVPVTVTGVHTISPGPGRIDGWNQDLRTLATTSAGTAGAQVLLGDFNASRDHGPFRRLLGTGLVDGAETVHTLPWRGVTWPANAPIPAAVRLDHVLVTPETVGVRSLRVLRVAGTDHRAVTAELLLAPIGP